MIHADDLDLLYLTDDVQDAVDFIVAARENRIGNGG